MPNELKTCPFCGGEAESCTHFLYGKIRGYFVACKMCDIETKMFTSKQGAENFWNRRADNG